MGITITKVRLPVTIDCDNNILVNLSFLVERESGLNYYSLASKEQMKMKSYVLPYDRDMVYRRAESSHDTSTYCFLFRYNPFLASAQFS
jgi:hypothetical protein